MIAPVPSEEPSSTMTHSAGGIDCASTLLIVAVRCASSSRTGVIITYLVGNVIANYRGCFAIKTSKSQRRDHSGRSHKGIFKEYVDGTAGVRSIRFLRL